MNISPTFLIQLLQFIAGIAILIIVHELGHFLAARLFKIDVEEFGIGFPPRALKLFEAGGTIFSLNWIPLGGFVKIKGENDPNVPGGLSAANPWVRLAVLSAGPLMNLGLAIVLSVLLFYSLGEPVLDKVEVQAISPGSPAEQAGLQVHDVIVKVDGQAVSNVDDLHTMIYDRLGTPLQMTLQRGDQVIDVTLTPRNPPPEDGAIGIVMGFPTQPTTWARAIPNGITASYEYAKSVLLLPIRMVQGQVSPEEGRPVGYKGMFDIYQELREPLWFFMVISMSLGIFNLFPIPALDGGRILFTLPEILLRRRVPAKYENAIHLVGFAMLLLLLIYINLQDFINPVQLPK
jgi:regulator of sigma E protease